MARNKSKQLARFESLDELIHFFDSHDLGDYLDQMPEADFDVDLKQQIRPFALDIDFDEAEVNKVSRQPTLAQVEEQVAQLSPKEQLKLMAHIAEQLSAIPLDTLKNEASNVQWQQEREADELLALCDAAAEMWEGEFDSAAEIRLMRKERDEQIWPSKS